MLSNIQNVYANIELYASVERLWYFIKKKKEKSLDKTTSFLPHFNININLNKQTLFHSFNMNSIHTIYHFFYLLFNISHTYPHIGTSLSLDTMARDEKKVLSFFTFRRTVHHFRRTSYRKCTQIKKNVMNVQKKKPLRDSLYGKM